jgi:hypothetical protein
MFSPSKRKQGFGYKINDEIKAGPLEVYGPLQNRSKPDTIHPYVILSTVLTSNICKRARLTKLSSNGPLVNRFSQHPNKEAEVQQLNAHYEASAPQQPKDAKNDEETNLHILAVSESARQLLKVLQPFDARITDLEAENTTLRMDSRNKEAMVQDLERKILRLQQDSQDRVTALEDEIADLQEQGQKDTDFLNEGIKLARVSINRKNAMLKQLDELE